MRSIRTILIVDANPALRQSLAEQLELNGEFAVAQCDSAAAALTAMPQHRFDAVLLDVGLPDMDGRELCRQMRDAGVNIPILMLADGDGDAETVLALDAGASDYVAKPFRVAVLLARLRAHLRQSELNDDTVLTIGPYAFRPSAKLLSDSSGSKKVRLTEKETAILKFLYRAGRTIGRDMLLGEVWGYSAGVTTHTLETHVYRLRRKIERDPANAEILVTEPGGYRLLP
jgi:DNA-binding response OmpR family regulator